MSCETSSSFDTLKLKIDDFPPGFSFKTISTQLKKYDSSEASGTFQGTYKMLPLPRLSTLCHVCAALTQRFTETASSSRHKMLRLPRICICAAAQSAPVTRKRHASIQTLLKYCACHAKRTRYLHACHKKQFASAAQR